MHEHLDLKTGLKLAVTTHFLAMEKILRSLEFTYRMTNSAIIKFVPEVCEAISEEVCDEVMPMPAETTARKD